MEQEGVTKVFNRLQSYFSKIIYDHDLYNGINWKYYVEFYDFSEFAPEERFWRSMRFGDHDVPEWISRLFELSYKERRSDAIRMLIEITEEQITKYNTKKTKKYDELAKTDVFDKLSRLLEDLKFLGKNLKPIRIRNTMVPSGNQSYEITPNISPLEMEFKEKFAFVLIPFNSEYTDHYTKIIESACKEVEINCMRADSISTPGQEIIRKVVRQIIDAELIIADITTLNANVMYELGIADAMGKKLIIMANREKIQPNDKGERKLPFDLGHRESLLYSTSTQSKFEEWKKQLVISIKSLL